MKNQNFFLLADVSLMDGYSGILLFAANGTWFFTLYCSFVVIIEEAESAWKNSSQCSVSFFVRQLLALLNDLDSPHLSTQRTRQVIEIALTRCSSQFSTPMSSPLKWNKIIKIFTIFRSRVFKISAECCWILWSFNFSFLLFVLFTFFPFLTLILIRSVPNFWLSGDCYRVAKV